MNNILEQPEPKKEHVIWEEKNLIEPSTNSVLPEELDKKNSTIEIKNDSTPKLCVDIGKEQRRKYAREYYKKNKEIIKLKYSEYRIKNKESLRLKGIRDRQKNPNYAKEYYQKNKEKNRNKTNAYSTSYYYNNKESRKLIHKLYRIKNKEKNKEYRIKNSITLTKKKRIYYLKNKEKIRISSKKYRDQNKDKYRLRRKIYYENNKKTIRQNGAINYLKNKDKHSQYAKNNREKINTARREHRLKNINFRIACNLRTRLYCALKRNQKLGSAVKDLGKSIDEFREYFILKFEPGMSWDNYGKIWHIDHITPLDSFDLTKKENLLRAVHFTNLQPMWATTEIAKQYGSTSVGNINKNNKILI